ncbi:MAG: mercury(II) reductase [Pseudomonadota bacterium]
METQQHLVIIGSGSGAFAAAIRATEMGARVTMIERGMIGGTCVNIGCVPSKTLIHAADIRHQAGHHPFAGMPTHADPVDLPPLMAQKDELVMQLRQAKYADILAQNPDINFIKGSARFVDAHTLQVSRPDGTTKTLRGDRFLIATGARPAIPNIPGLAGTPYWTSTTALEAQQLPKELLVLGGGIVAVELAQAFARLGSQVTIIARSTLLSGEDSELGSALADYFQAEGIRVLSHSQAEQVHHDGLGFTLTLTSGKQLQGEALLVATGRRANTEDLNLEAASLQTSTTGSIPVNEYLQTNVTHIYAAGDVTDQPQFVYVAAAAGTRAANNALGGEPESLDLSVMPAVVFTDPQVATVGLSETQARAEGIEVISRVLPLDAVPRALANRDTRGFIKLVARAEDQVLIGAQVLAPNGGELIQTAVLAIHAGMTVTALGKMLFPYLTMVEGLKLAAQTFSKDVKQLSCCAD